MPQQQQQGKDEGMRMAANSFYVLTAGMAWTVVPFFHWNMGVEAIGIRGVLAMVAIWGYCALARCPEMVTFFWVWLAAILVQRIRGIWLARRGVVVHSRYMGDPILLLIQRFIRRADAARVLQACICFTAGCWLMEVSEALGQFIIFGSVAMLLLLGIDSQIMKRRVQAISDLEIEQATVHHEYRQRRTGY